MKQKPYKSVNVPLDEDLAYQLEQTMIAFGLDDRRTAAAALMRAGASALSGDAFLSTVLDSELKRFRENESDALATFFEERAKLFRTR